MNPVDLAIMLLVNHQAREAGSTEYDAWTRPLPRHRRRGNWRSFANVGDPAHVPTHRANVPVSTP